MFLELLFAASLATPNVQVVHVEGHHWRVLLENAPQIKPTLLTLENGKWSGHSMSKIELPKETIWVGEANAKENFSYAIWTDPKPYKTGTEGQVLDQSGTGPKITPDPIIVKSADFPIPESPRWALATTLCRVEIDRFDHDGTGGLGSVGGPNRIGGNLRGILKHTDYFTGLGQISILLSPLAAASDPFGRTITDPNKLEPKFGDPGDLKDVLEELHRNSLYTLAEGPIPPDLPSLDGWKIASERPTWDSPKDAQTAILTNWFETAKNWILDPDAKATDFEGELKLDRLQIPENLQTTVIHELGDQNAPRPSNIFKDLPRLHQAWVLLFTYPGIPLFRAGDEIGLHGGPFPDNRDPMPWNPGLENASLQSFVKNLIALRSRRPSMWRGSYETIVTDDDKGLFGFTRQDRFQATLVIFNNSDKVQSYSTAAGRFGDNLTDLIGTSSMGVTNGILSVTIPAHECVLIGSP